MVNLFKDIEAGRNPPEEINIIIEVSAGASNKIEYNHEAGCFELNRALYTAVHYPFEYGFVPRTLSGDGDPIDALLLLTHPTFPGCVIRARPVGMLLMKDEAGIDNKLICVPITEVDPRFENIADIEDLPEHTRKEIEVFMMDYKKLEKKKMVKMHGWKNAEETKKVILDEIKRFKEAYPNV